LDDWTIHKINDPTINSILPEKGSLDNCSEQHFKELIHELDKSLERKIKFIKSI